MSWLVLVLSGVFETIWAAALGAAKGFSRPVPTVVFALALALSMGGLAYALREIPLGTGYAIWVGIGTLGTAAYGMLALGDPATTARITCLALIVAGVVGLKLLH
ncbi:SMR family transporter [Amycolatopsis sp. NPDC049159]|uniref:DMT family transporter n=1 Tax=Amycolatopsis sp. NPDC049159 TaxID=3157210 RepID=UPI00340162A7